MADSSSQLPFIVRLAGLPVDVLAAFESSVCTEPLEQIHTLDQEIEQLRGELVDLLFEEIGGAAPEARGSLVALKRDVYNGRPLSRWPQRAEWALIEPKMGPGIQRVLTLEQRREQQLERLQELHGKQVVREEQALTELTGDSLFVRGLGLSSLMLARSLPRLGSGKLRAKRRRRMMTGLVRYATRTALKLSPYSTLTLVGMGRAVDRGAGHAIPGELRLHSGVWLHRYLLERLVDILGTHRAFRSGLELRLNDTLETLPDGRLRFLRPRRWEPNPDDKGMTLRKPALVKVGLDSPVTQYLRRHLATTSKIYDEVLHEMVAEFADRGREDLASFIDRLVDIGFLLVSPPWPSTEIDVQQRLLAYLEESVERHALGAELAEVTDLLRSLLDVLEKLPSSDDPVPLLTQSKDLSESLGRAAMKAAGVDPSVRFFRDERDHYFSEDVFTTPEPPRVGDTLLSLPADEVDALAKSVAPLAHVTGAVDNRDDYLLTLGVVAKERWPRAKRVPFLDFFEQTQPVYREYIRYQMQARRNDRPRNAEGFNPRGLAAITSARAARVEMTKQIKGLFSTTEEGKELDHSRLTDLLSSMGGSGGDCRDFSAFLQPFESDPGPRRWVLSDLFEGAGRLSSRYTTAMPDGVRAAWTEALTERSFLVLHGKEVEILDLYCPEGHTLNVHAPLTRSVLELPGEKIDLPEGRRLRLTDLAIDLTGPLPALVGPTGKPLAPLHLGGVVVRYMPSLFKFLTLFGATELIYRIPVAAGHELEDMRVIDRHTIGSVVYRRKTWTLDRGKVLPRFKDLQGAALMRAVDRWRRRRGVPCQVFMQEPVEGGLSNPHRKPQFIDFSSPALVELFRTILLNDFPAFLLAEALPSTQQHPFAEDGRRRAYEIQIETFGAPRAANDALGAVSAAPTLDEDLPAAIAGEA